MLANYHTHTYRCNHADGSEREYIENAINAGMKILGFSDHTPQFYNSGFVSGMRMSVKQAPEYISCIKKLAEEYKDDIKIYVGFEAEYFPDIFEKLQDFCRNYGADYMIMGQHFLDSEEYGIYVGTPHSEPSLLKRYVDQILEGTKTGAFSYLAHPDVFNFVGDDDFYNKEMTRLCEELKKMNIPLEINMLGYEGKRHYPSKRFFNIAKNVGNDVIIGCDAHTPLALSNIRLQNETYDFAVSLGLSPLSKITLKEI